MSTLVNSARPFFDLFDFGVRNAPRIVEPSCAASSRRHEKAWRFVHANFFVVGFQAIPRGRGHLFLSYQHIVQNHLFDNLNGVYLMVCVWHFNGWKSHFHSNAIFELNFVASIFHKQRFCNFSRLRSTVLIRHTIIEKSSALTLIFNICRNG